MAWGEPADFARDARADRTSAVWRRSGQTRSQSRFSRPSWGEPLGTDHYGRSNFARLSSAIATSLTMAVACVSSSALLGLVTGVVAAWKRGWWDRGFSWLLNMLLAMPGLILVLLFGAMVPGSFSSSISLLP